VHGGGVTSFPGLYLMGMPFLRRRKSTLIDGAGADARHLTAHLAAHLYSLVRGGELSATT
jgi:putative flavoprotein involved in K+ transport